MMKEKKAARCRGSIRRRSTPTSRSTRTDDPTSASSTQRSNRRDQAIAALTKATTLNSKNAVAWNWLGMEQRDAGDRAAAEQAYLKALQVKPDSPTAHLNLAFLRHLHGPALQTRWCTISSISSSPARTSCGSPRDRGDRIEAGLVQADAGAAGRAAPAAAPEQGTTERIAAPVRKE